MAVVMLVAGCAHPSAPGPPAPASLRPPHVNPANIKKVADLLPAGYEIAGVTGVSSPAAIWGFSGAWTANPPQCAVLADPLGRRGGSAHGVSGSGPGGISYAVVAAGVPTGTQPADCGHWVMRQRRSTANVHLIDAPHIDGVDTVGMSSEISAFVEGGTEIDSRADTFAAYLGDYYAFTVLIVDPGAAHPPLDARFAADLLVKTVSALRG